MAALVISAVAGTAHGLFSLYWALGGDWLVSTLGDQLAEEFADARRLLFPVGVVKVGFAVLPLVMAARGWPRRRLWRPVCWLGALVLVVWGGTNAAVGNLVLSGLVRPAGGYDRAGMIGHAWLWDPLFLVWGLALAIGLLVTRRRTLIWPNTRHG